MATVPPQTDSVKQIQCPHREAIGSGNSGSPPNRFSLMPVLWRATERPPAVAKPFPPNRFTHDFHILVFRNFASELRTGNK